MSSQVAARVEAVRRFNRFYTRQIGLLRDQLWSSSLSLPEARVLYEVAHHGRTTAAHLSQELGLDQGYLSRVVRMLTQRGLLTRSRSDVDRRRWMLSLAPAGESAFSVINTASREEIREMLKSLDESGQRLLVESMERIETLLRAPPEHRTPYVLRRPQSGDYGWIVHRHGALYGSEYGWNQEFEALVAEIVAQFVRSFDSSRERCWIAEREGEIVGSVFLVRHPQDAGVARLRLLLVEPSARGLGIGRRLVCECTQFARHAGYKLITLWTNDVLTAARRIYETEGYVLVHEEPHHSFGADLTGQTWELDLRALR